jgi:hypothetical protein
LDVGKPQLLIHALNLGISDVGAVEISHHV